MYIIMTSNWDSFFDTSIRGDWGVKWIRRLYNTCDRRPIGFQEVVLGIIVKSCPKSIRDFNYRNLIKCLSSVDLFLAFKEHALTLTVLKST